MGCRNTKESTQTVQEEKHVEKMLEEAKEEEARHYKLLLLGAGEAGKVFEGVISWLLIIYFIKQRPFDHVEFFGVEYSLQASQAHL